MLQSCLVVLQEHIFALNFSILYHPTNHFDYNVYIQVARTYFCGVWMIESGGITKMAASLPNLNQIPGPFLFVPPLHTGLCSICRQPPGNDSVAIWSSEKNENKEVGTLLWKYAGLKVSKDQGPGILCKLCLSRLKEIQKKVDQFRKGQFTGKAKQNLHLPGKC